MDAWKKLVKDASNLASFYAMHIDGMNRLCETDWLGVNKDIKEILKFYKNELRLSFQYYILTLKKCLRKTLFQHTVPEGGW